MKKILKAEILLNEKFRKELNSAVYEVKIKMLDKDYKKYYFEAEDDRQNLYSGTIELVNNKVKLFKEIA